MSRHQFFCKNAKNISCDEVEFLNVEAKAGNFASVSTQDFAFPVDNGKKADAHLQVRITCPKDSRIFSIQLICTVKNECQRNKDILSELLESCVLDIAKMPASRYLGSALVSSNGVYQYSNVKDVTPLIEALPKTEEKKNLSVTAIVASEIHKALDDFLQDLAVSAIGRFKK